MKSKNKVFTITAMLLLIIGIAFAPFSTSQAKIEDKDGDDICTMWQGPEIGCDVPEVNCMCPIIVTP